MRPRYWSWAAASAEGGRIGWKHLVSYAQRHGDQGPSCGALVTAHPFDSSGKVGSAELGHATNHADGTYSLTISGYSGAVQFVAAGTGVTTVADEASGQTVTSPADFHLHAKAVVAAASGSQTLSASLTRFTELANQLAQGYGGLTAANSANANGVVFRLLGLGPVATALVASNAARSPTSTASVAQLRCGPYLAISSCAANQTGQTIGAGDSVVALLEAQASAVADGTAQ